MLGLLFILPLTGFAIAATSCNNVSDDSHAAFVSGSKDVKVLTGNSTSSVIIIDYGHEVEGIPSFEVLNREGDTSLFEVSYAESLASFDGYMVGTPISSHKICQQQEN